MSLRNTKNIGEMTKKRKNIDLKTLWARHAKSQKIAPASTPKQISVECKVDVNSPSIQKQEQNGCGNVSDRENEIGAAEMYDLDLLPPDPGMRIPISSYNANEQDAVRRGYIALGSRQTRAHSFPQRKIEKGMHRFVASWFDRYGWLEYSVERDAAFCFVCYLFKDNTTCTSGDDFVNGGFRNWNEPDKFEKHIGGINTAHNQAQGKYDLFVKPAEPIIEHLHRKSMQDKALSKTWLTHSLKCLRCPLCQGLAACGHSEGPESSDEGNFLELLNGLAENFEDVAKVFPKHAEE